MKRRIRVAEKGIRSDIARAVNQLAEQMERQRLVALPGQAVTETANGTALKVTSAAGSGVADPDVFY
jgi:predicted transcriptional regulator